MKVGAVWNPQQEQRVPATGERRFSPLNVLTTIERGFGIATFNYADVDPDALGAIAQGIRGVYLKPGQTEPAPGDWAVYLDFLDRQLKPGR